MKVIGFFFATLVALGAAQFGLPIGGITKNTGGVLSNTLNKATSLFTEQFGSFKKNFQKVYASPEEEKKRLGIFSENQQSILDFNKLTDGKFTMKVNEFADLLGNEFNKVLNGLKLNRQKSKGTKFVHQPDASVPVNVDWRKQGAVTPVRSQGQCASCYAFAAAGALEGHLFRKTGKLTPISPQNLMDCTEGKPYENYGCTYGAVDPAFDYIKDNKGVNEENNYPYEGKSGLQCRYQKDSSIASLGSYVLIDEGDEKAIEEVVATKGPVAVGIDASAKSFQLYGSGIYYEPQCGSTIDKINHAVLVIGFGTETNGEKYWLIKNSYGPTWGENGYAKIGRNVTNPCGIATYALYPII